MTSLIKRIVPFLALLLAAPCAAWADISYATAGSSYTQNFDSLNSSTAGNPFAWANDSTIAGWYSNRTTYNAGTGTNNDGSLYSFGVGGVNPITDRALGSVTSNSTSHIRMGIAFVNNTGTTLNTINITYTGEQWRRANNASTDSLAFDYKKSATSIAIIDSGFTTLSALNFTSPIVGTGTATALDGNLAANRIAGITAQLTGLNWANGQTLFLRWTDSDLSGSAHGLAIDNFVFTGNVPEPSSIAFLAGVGVIGAIFARRRIMAKRKRI